MAAAAWAFAVGSHAATHVPVYPVIDSSFDSGFYHQSAEGCFLRRDAMQGSLEHYTTGDQERSDHRLAASGRVVVGEWLPGTTVAARLLRYASRSCA